VGPLFVRSSDHLRGELRWFLSQPQKGVLDHVLAPTALTEESSRVAEESRLVAKHEGLEGSGLAAPKALEQLSV